MTAAPAFRSDINGLRAWAVVSVILYHFGVPGFKGGFVGVDVFFVISGFLMTGIVVKTLEQGSFSLLGFYMARARRILPALVMLCVVLLGLGWIVLLPPDYKTLATHAISSVGFFSNFKYWNEAGYFDLASHEKWLLHTWSLSVEWQFYLILPIGLWLVWRLKPGRRAQTWAIVVALIISLLASIGITENSPTSAFFLIHTRAWEMLSGGLVFMVSAGDRIKTMWRGWLATCGLALILLSVNAFDLTSAWPGWRALLPVMAAMLVLIANNSSRWTDNKAAQWIGDRSYSLYLWHWPVFVALVYVELQNRPQAIVGGILLTLCLGHFSFVWVERSSRRYLSATNQKLSAGLLVSGAALAIVLAAAIRLKDGVSGRFPPTIELASAEAFNFNPRRNDCHSHSGTTSPSCVLSGGRRTVIAVGDSHVVATISAMAKAQNKAEVGVVWWSYSGCPFVPGLRATPENQARSGRDYHCTEFNDWVMQQLHSTPKSIPIVIIGRYASAAFGANENRRQLNVPEFYFSTVSKVTTTQFLQEFSEHIVAAACQLARERPVFMMHPIPEMGVDVPKTLSRRMAMGIQDDISISIEDYRKRNDWVWQAQSRARDQCGVKILDPTHYLCKEERCFGSKGGRPLYFDDDHLSEYGNTLLIPMFAQIFDSKK